MNTLTIDYPDTLPDAIQKTREQFEEEARMAMAVKLFEMKWLSSGQAAELAGIDRVTFLLNLHHYNVPMIDLDGEELISDIENAKHCDSVMGWGFPSLPFGPKDYQTQDAHQGDIVKAKTLQKTEQPATQRDSGVPNRG